MTRKLTEIERKIQATKSLDELIDFLNNGEYDAHDADIIDISALPTFGGPDVKNTNEVYSWDATRIMVAGSGGEWTTEPRCKTCGEATFHCNHS